MNTVKTATKVHALTGVETFPGYGPMAVTACNTTVLSEGIGHDEVTCKRCLKILAACPYCAPDEPCALHNGYARTRARGDERI